MEPEITEHDEPVAKQPELAETPARAKPSRLLIASTALLLAASAVYLWRPAILAAIYIWPFTLWVLIGLTFVWLAYKTRLKLRLILTSIWFVAWLSLDDQPWAFIPNFDQTYPPEATIVSLNCAGGDIRAATEAARTGADIILLQESPPRAELEALASSLGKDWNAVVGVDASILSNRKISPVPIPRQTLNFTAAEMDDCLIVSLRLNPPIFRLDYWSPDCWREYAENRLARKKELDEILAWVHANLKDRKLILGGDFNTPPDPWVQSCLDDLAEDAFVKSGEGWGGTAINEAPLARIDQIWLSGFQSHSTRVYRSNISDHRYVAVTIYTPT